MIENDPGNFANDIVALIESEKQRPVRTKKIPLKYMDSADSLSDVYSAEQLSSKHLYFFVNELLHDVFFVCMHEFVLIRAYL